MSAKPLAVVVCTRNRARALADVLADLRGQTLDPAAYETIVVDNGSTDGTRAVATASANRDVGVRYLLEEQQGLSHARNRGWRETDAGYVVYVDDDCRIPRGYLAAAAEVAEQIAPAIFGGPYFPEYVSPRPEWYKDAYFERDRGPEPRALSEHEYLDGCNIAFRRVILDALGGFDPALGMNGRRIGYGEEVAPQRRLREMTTGQMIYYDPRLAVRHVVPERKMQFRWLVPQQFALGRDVYAVFGGKLLQPSSTKAKLRHAARLLLDVAGDVLVRAARRDRQRYPWIQRYLYEVTLPRVQRLGALYQQHRERRVGRADGPRGVRVVLGAGHSRPRGWLATDRKELDVTSDESWAARFRPGQIDRLLAEHVFEHLTRDECAKALTLCFRFLRAGGLLRIAVPDGNRRDAAYVREVAPPNAGHQVLFTVADLCAALETAGFAVMPLEYFDEGDKFHAEPWDIADGFILRSVRFDHQTGFRRGDLFYTSLIVDARKPEAAACAA